MIHSRSWAMRGCCRHVAATGSSAWQGVQTLPADPILGLVAAFKEDAAAVKVNVAQGAYRTDEGSPWVLASIKEAERRVAADLQSGQSDKEYLPIEGDACFRSLSARLAFGESSPALMEGRLVTLQTISGTGAVSAAASALKRIAGKKRHMGLEAVMGQSCSYLQDLWLECAFVYVS